MTRAPAAGERAALRGYRRQYDHIATLVYDALVADEFVSLRLTDPEAGRVDDLVLLTRRSVDGYQFKSAEFPGAVTFSQLLAPGRTRSGNPAPSPIEAFADGWNRLRVHHGTARVHLVTEDYASVNDHLGDTGNANAPSPDHFHAFLDRVLIPISTGGLSITDVPTGWLPALERLRATTGLPQDVVDEFLQNLYIEMGTASPLPTAPSTRRSDIIALSDALYRLVSGAPDVVVLDRRAVLDLVEWADRPRLRSRHDFPVDLDTYAPLNLAIAELDQHLTDHAQGYVGVVGPPGSGKSTLLSQGLSGRPDRVVRYYAYVPGTAPLRTRMTARAFVHDLVVMLGEAGLAVGERQLPSDDIDRLRQQVTELLDAAGQDFRSTGRRTVIVIDGLDHVERDYPGVDGMLPELPRPGELPEGVLLVIGSRTLSPLNAHARQHLEERGSVIDLQHHRLARTAVLDVCRRAPMTTDLDAGVHARIADLSDGHPLALGYLLNRLSNVEDPNTALDDAPAYEGDIAAEYRAVWDAVESDAGVTDILAVCARLRIGFDLNWIAEWAAPAAVHGFRRQLLYLFRRHHDGWRFFHDSFRQFAADRTAQDHAGRPDQDSDATVHKRIADLCADAGNRPHVGDEQLYHRFHATEADAVLLLARPDAFRQQYARFRALDLIRADIGLALGTAADRADVTSTLRLLLCLVEAGDRATVLESIDMPTVLHDAGLIDEAIAYCGGDNRQVPLAQAYNLAAKLGRTGDPAGRRIFDLVEHDGLEDPGHRVAGAEDDAARAWGRAAPLFRPLPAVLATVERLRTDLDDHDRDDDVSRRRREARYRRVMKAVIDSIAATRDDAALQAVDDELAAAVTGVTSGSDLDDEYTHSAWANLVDLRVRTQRTLARLRTATGGQPSASTRLIATIDGAPMFTSSILSAAETLAEQDRIDVATELLRRVPFHRALTVTSLSHNGEPDAIDTHFRYWRLRHVIANKIGDDSFVAATTPPASATPAGDDVVPDAPVHTDVDAIELATRIDAAVLTLARIDAATTAGDPLLPHETWSALLSLLGVFRAAARPRSSATLGGIAQQKPRLMHVVVSVATRHSAEMASRLADVLTQRFAAQPDRWPLKLRLGLARQLRQAGVAAPWYDETLALAESAAGNQDVHSRLEDTAALVHRYAADGNTTEARRLAATLVPMAFGVGYRKDYQFDAWVQWLGRALAESGGIRYLEEAGWLARVLDAANPMTEGAPGSAAARLPAEVVRAGPRAGVRLFTHLVGHGTVDHIDAVAQLITALLEVTGPGDERAVALAADLTTDLVASASRRTHRKLAEALSNAAARTLDPRSARTLIDRVAERITIYALPSTRDEWLRALGLVTAPDTNNADNADGGSSDYGTLVLTDGRRIPREQVPRLAVTANDIVTLRQLEAPESRYQWMELFDRREYDAAEIDTLVAAFDDNSRSGAEVLTVLAERALQAGRADVALRWAERALHDTRPDSWSGHYGGARRRAAAVVVAAGGEPARIGACQDLARQAMDNRWFAGLLTDELAQIVDALDPGLSAQQTWPEIRGHLEGIAAALPLPDDDPFANRGPRWWLPTPGSLTRPTTSPDDPAAALGEIATLHLAHPTWVARDAAVRVVAAALGRGDESTAAALAAAVTDESPDDVVEYAGRALAAARTIAATTPASLHALERTLAEHPSQVVRDVASTLLTFSRPLTARYRLVLPTPASLLGRPAASLAPHDEQYHLLAEQAGIPRATLAATAQNCAEKILEGLPTDEAMREALRGAEFGHYFPYAKVWASRAAFGRVLADLRDAGRLDHLPAALARELRTVDADLLAATPEQRPSVVPAPPAAGHDQTLSRWLDDLEVRLHEYVAAADTGGVVLLAATGILTVLNWGHLEEEVSCGTVVGDDTPDDDLLGRTSSVLLRDLAYPAEPWHPTRGEPLVLANAGHTFQQLQGDWLSFRPDVAAGLGWIADRDRPGRWRTTAGAVAVDRVWWVDGWWGHTSRAFDDTAAQGHAVILSKEGAMELTAALGPLVRRLSLTRTGRESGDAVPPVIATRTLLIKP